ncbi:hypothetical protein [Bradyrhizobium sp.]|uniref:hypothetical protein n=1 Tax=Bradyrhizobium sp. TaxID=376 RepID=UPI003C3151F6
MTVFSTARLSARDWQGRGHLLPILAATALAAGAIALVAYLLWPTWNATGSTAPERLPVSIGGTLFNVPTASIRMKIQRHSGPQERIDLNFSYPSLEPPDAARDAQRDVSTNASRDAQRPVGAETLEQPAPAIDRIFLSIAAHEGALAPEVRLRTIYPRYLEDASTPGPDGLTMRGFRRGTPYGGEDLFVADAPYLTARCSRDAATPGMCLSERRIEGADLTFRFPRSWLAQWRDVADAMDRLTLQLHAAR